jgi:hypothetical protein
MHEGFAKVQVMSDEQINSSTIFDAYRNLFCAQMAFAQGVMQANAKMWRPWSKASEAAKDERLSVAAIRPEVMTA